MAITITAVKARQIFDSRGNPTVEALELRDGGSDYLGKGVSKVSFITFVIFSQLGANAILAVSLAVCKAGAHVKKIPLYKHIAELSGNKNLVLPVPAFNVINGGSHAGNKLAMQVCFLILPLIYILWVLFHNQILIHFFLQEFMILPVGASSFKEAMKMGVEAVIKKKYGQDATNVGDEGGFAPNIQVNQSSTLSNDFYLCSCFVHLFKIMVPLIQENKEGLELLNTAIAKAGYTGKVVIGMDVAASEFYGSDKTYDLNFKEENNDGSQKISGDALKDLYKSFISDYPIVSIEDPFDQDDWEHYAKLTSEVGEKVQIVGDDLLVTNPKVNQIGSVTESIEAVRMSKQAGWGVMASHRSGETEDTFIADLSVGLATGQIKTGAPCRSERLAKYNQLLRIEEELGAEAVYAGAKFRAPVEPY
ncbi:Enolase [Citrus sinensis]|nr:Enolase [Citrus sinensis]